MKIERYNSEAQTAGNRSMTQSPNHSMFWRVWFRSLSVKRPQSALAFAALALGAAVASLLLNLYGDAGRKMQSEFRAYGPNVVVAPADSGTGADARGATVASSSSGLSGGLMGAGILGDLQGRLPSGARGTTSAVAVPVLYAVAWTRPGKLSSSIAPARDLVAVGADFDALRALNPSWRLSASPDPFGAGTCVLGSHAAESLRLKPGDALELAARSRIRAAAQSDERATACSIAAVVSSGAAEDDQVFLPLDALQAMTGLTGKISLVEMRIAGTPGNIEAAVSDLTRAFPSVELRPVREIVEGEGRVLAVIRGLLLALAALIVGVVALCVTATVTTIVLERRKDVAVMKALGASDRKVLALLLAEIGALGLAGGLVGFAAGALLARRLGVDLFGVALNTDWRTLAPVLAAALLAAALPALLPVSTVRSIDPARALRGE